MAKYAIFTLNMPNRGSWNGGWSGAKKKYVVCRQLKKSEENKFDEKDSFYYNFGDGWGARVDVKVVDGYKAKDKEYSGSSGFCGYDWMVDSIMKYGEIKCR